MNYIINKVRSIIAKVKKDIADSREREKKRKEIRAMICSRCSGRDCSWLYGYCPHDIDNIC